MEPLSAAVKLGDASCVCLGSGRFLVRPCLPAKRKSNPRPDSCPPSRTHHRHHTQRAVLVPAVEEAGLPSVIFQTRGDSFPKMMYGDRYVHAGNAPRHGHPTPSDATLDADPLTSSATFYLRVSRAKGSYEVDTVEFDGRVATAEHAVVAAGTLGTAEGRRAFLGLPSALPKLRVIGVGVTEAGVAEGSQAMRDLAEFLLECCRADVKGPLSVINTDNVPGNGPKIEGIVTSGKMMETLGVGADEEKGFRAYLAARVVFHTTMVDRITSQRPGSDGDVPRAEPLPAKALVIEDLKGVRLRCVSLRGVACGWWRRSCVCWAAADPPPPPNVHYRNYPIINTHRCSRPRWRRAGVWWCGARRGRSRWTTS